VNRKQHLAQAEIILAGLRKLTMPGDYLAIVDGAMVAGYHLGNALLHARGVSTDAEHTNTPSKLECAIDTLPVEIRSAFTAFAELEKFRFDFVRSASVYDARLDAEVWRCLKTMHDACTAM
jgi:hypothetical protein